MPKLEIENSRIQRNSFFRRVSQLLLSMIEGAVILSTIEFMLVVV